MDNATHVGELMPIAIIGMSCRLPGASDVDAYWRNLKAGVESITFLSDAELMESHVDPALLTDPSYVRAGGMLEHTEYFDASFFGYSPREASLMEPQHRMFLECAWEALEHAGYTSQSHDGAIGVFGGAAMNGYLLFNLATRPDVAPALFDFQIQIGNDKDYLTTRVSYKLNLKGPSINVQTACSTSLVAIHVACQSLLNGECNLALAGGVSISVPQKVGYRYQEGGIHSSDGHCRAFDAEASGTVFGSGVGIVVLKRLADAQADGDHIHAVIKGSAVNNDGSAKVGYTAPSVDGQAAVIAEALAVAGLDAGSISFVETHGTGTAMGDPIEVKALTQAFRQTTTRTGYCAVGSVKTNIGHLDVASGVAGLIKTALALEYGLIPPTLNFRTANPEIDFENSPFFVNAALSDWQMGPRRAGVSSFGLGGTNAHVVLEEAPPIEAPSPSRPYQLLLLSAKSPKALDRMGERLANHLESHPEQNIADIAFTLQTGREVFSQRRAVVGRDRHLLVDALRGRDRSAVATALDESRGRTVVFMFPGQGAQHVGMGRDLYASEPVFREHVDRCAELLTEPLGVDLRDLIYPEAGHEEAAAELLQQTWITQPALFVIEYSLARLWMEWGVRPQVLIGHSIGEYVAACLAGVLALEDALRLVAARGRLMQDLPGGTMLAVDLPEDALGDLAAQGVALAAVNAPSRCVLSGRAEAVERIERRLTEEGHRCRRLHTSHAFHSAMMDPILDRFAALVSTISLHPPQIPLISNLSGTWMTPEEATDPGYYARHLRRTVRFADGIVEAIRDSDRIVLEVGPGRTLGGSLVQQFAGQSTAPIVLSSMRHPQQQEPDTSVLLSTLGRLWLAGARVDWSGFHAHQRRRRVALPTYPFERQRHWIEPGRQVFASTASSHPAAAPATKKRAIENCFQQPFWKQVALPATRRPVADEGPWLVFARAGGLGERIARHLEQSGEDVVTIFPGDRADWGATQCHTVNPKQREDYDDLIKALDRSGKLPRSVIHAWNLEPEWGIEADAGGFDRAQDFGFNSLLFLAQALGARNFSDALGITVLASGVQAVTGNEALFPERAPLLGACIVLPQEFPNLDCRCLDLILPESGGMTEDVLIAQVLNEVGSDATDLFVAYRGLGRWVQDYRSVLLEAGAGIPKRLRDRGVYLITGGLGAIGFALAEYLATSVRARLVLTGRSDWPERDKWSQWLADHDANDASSLRIRRVQALEALGAEVLVVSADVSDREQMQTALMQANKRFGRIDGVIHGAGIVAEEAFLAIQDTTRANCDRHFRPKAHGLLVLRELLKKQPPDFYFLLSSISSILGGLGYAPYAAANLYLDAVAQKCAQQSPGSWISVNWDAWMFGTARADRPGMGSIVADLALSSEDGVEAFRRILANDTDVQIAVSTTDLRARVNQWVKRRARSGDNAAPMETTADSTLSISGNEDYDTEMQAAIARIWREVLGVSRVDLQENFFDVGGDSLLLMDVIARLKSTYGIVLNPREIMFQTLGQLAAVCTERKTAKADNQESPRTASLFDSIKRKIRGGERLET